MPKVTQQGKRERNAKGLRELEKEGREREARTPLFSQQSKRASECWDRAEPSAVPRASDWLG